MFTLNIKHPTWELYVVSINNSYTFYSEEELRQEIEAVHLLIS